MSSTRARATTQVEAGATTDANAGANAGAANDATAKAAVPAVAAVAAPDGGEATSRGLVVVGPGASFGVELLRRFGEEGFALGVVTRSAETLGRIRGELAAQELTVSGLVADVTDAAGLTRAIERVATEIGGLTALVYNAKISIRGAALTVAPATLTETFAVNVTGALAAIQAGVGPLTQRPGATIVLTSTSPRTAPVAGRFTLAVGKSGLTALAEALRPVLAARGVRLRTVLLDGRIAPDGPLRPRDVAEHFWQAYAAPRGDIFRLAPARRDTPVAQLPLEV